jgi:hypothetical protein
MMSGTAYVSFRYNRTSCFEVYRRSRGRCHPVACPTDPAHTAIDRDRTLQQPPRRNAAHTMEPQTCRESPRAGQGIASKFDKAWEMLPIEELAQGPVAAYEGASESPARTPRAAFNIKS